MKPLRIEYARHDNDDMNPETHPTKRSNEVLLGIAYGAKMPVRGTKQALGQMLISMGMKLQQADATDQIEHTMIFAAEE